ncbi:hypothetical protein BJV78DRAFT_1155159 [Lactifluus subvellereus]|nr:hypothetical protein BJV78DRAFT_1155159 [Lactifluus subvellereus]
MSGTYIACSRSPPTGGQIGDPHSCKLPAPARLGNTPGIDESGPDIMAIYINGALEADEYLLYQADSSKSGNGFCRVYWPWVTVKCLKRPIPYNEVQAKRSSGSGRRTSAGRLAQKGGHAPIRWSRGGRHGQSVVPHGSDQGGPERRLIGACVVAVITDHAVFVACPITAAARAKCRWNILDSGAGWSEQNGD